MKKLTLSTLIFSTITYFVVDYRKFKTDLLVRHAAGESDWERNHPKKRV
jgi:hypothetical protein